jgi:hypothetical protein
MAGVRMDDPNGQGVGFGSKRNAQSVGFSYSDIPYVLIEICGARWI